MFDGLDYGIGAGIGGNDSPTTAAATFIGDDNDYGRIRPRLSATATTSATTTALIFGKFC
jgi:hypothetical protein